MNFGEDLSKEFENLVKGKKFTEIQLCTKLEDAFMNLSSVHRMCVEVIHGSKSMVEFEYKANYIRGITTATKKKCELGDMMFIVFSKKKNQFRLMYMQNKKGKAENRFYADMIQLDLLNRKPTIISSMLPECVFGNKNILKDAVLSSVTSYGIFYEDKRGCYNMSYLLATNALPKRSIGDSKKRIVQYNSCSWGFVDVSTMFEESQAEKSIECFGNALFNMQIGTPITDSETLNNLKKFLQKHSLIWNNGELGDRFLNIEGDFPTVCIINADFNMDSYNTERVVII